MQACWKRKYTYGYNTVEISPWGECCSGSSVCLIFPLQRTLPIEILVASLRFALGTMICVDIAHDVPT